MSFLIGLEKLLTRNLNSPDKEFSMKKMNQQILDAHDYDYVWAERECGLERNFRDFKNFRKYKKNKLEKLIKKQAKKSSK